LTTALIDSKKTVEVPVLGVLKAQDIREVFRRSLGVGMDDFSMGGKYVAGLMYKIRERLK
jgi:hypothetical protein